MDPPFGIGECPVLLGEAGGGQHHIGLTCRFRHKNVLDHEKFKVLYALFRMIQIRIRHEWILTDNIEGLEFTVIGLRDHFRGLQAGGVRQRHAPGLFHLLPGRRVCYLLVSGIHIRQAAHIAGALNVVLSAQRIDAAARHAHVAAEHGQVGQGLDVVGTGRMLRDPHAVQNAAGLGPGVQRAAPPGHPPECR